MSSGHVEVLLFGEVKKDFGDSDEDIDMEVLMK